MLTDDCDTKLMHGDLTGRIIGGFYAVYDELGYGFLESVYRNALVYELLQRGLSASIETPVDVWYKGQRVGHYRADIIVAETVVIEAKASRAIDEADRKQLMNYLRATNLEVGLLLHFGPKAAFQRIVFENQRKRASNASAAINV
jgi:GxxExxY protein